MKTIATHPRPVHIILSKIWLLVCLLFLMTTASATIRYVKENATGAGTSWNNASGDVQAMINASASGDEVWVAGGYYSVSTNFNMKQGVSIYGNFAGTETALSQRNLANTANTSWLWGNGSTTIFNYGVSSPALLDGFAISGGTSDYGGGIFNYGSSPTISNCNITGNFAIWGGGVCNYYSNGTFINCSINGNSATSGGGTYDHWSTTTYLSCTISGNSASVYTGGVFCINGNAPSGKLINCMITGNKAGSLGAGVGIYETSLDIINCTIAGNLAPAAKGGGIFFTANTTGVTNIKNSIIYNNSSGIDIENGNNLANISTSLVQGLTATGNGNINTNPGFTNPVLFTSAPTSAGDYHLISCSPAINTGSNVVYAIGQSPDLTSITTDLDKTARIQGSIVDMGAYEFTGTNNANQLCITGDLSSRIIAGRTDLTAMASSCRLLATVQPDGTGTAVTGSVTGKAWIESTQPAIFLKRHYEITPSSPGATGTVTLYYSQVDFNAFNAVNSVKLPTGPTDATGKANLRIEQRTGSSSNGSGLPPSYSSIPLTIDPADANVVWNAVAGRWEVTVAVTGFGAFFIKTQLYTLPLQLLNFNGSRQYDHNLLQWTTAKETNTSYFELERRTDTGRFRAIATINATGGGHYSYRDVTANNSTRYYYRLKMVDADGQFTYSATIVLANGNQSNLTVYPNPANDVVYINTDNSLVHSSATLYNANGRLLQNVLITANQQPVDVHQLPGGVYFLKFANGNVTKLLVSH